MFVSPRILRARDANVHGIGDPLAFGGLHQHFHAKVALELDDDQIVAFARRNVAILYFPMHRIASGHEVVANGFVEFRFFQMI